MKQFTFILEAVVKDNKPTIILRDPRSGQIVNVANDFQEVATFLSQSIYAVEDD